MRAIYEDVRRHGPPTAVVIALMRLGQLDADLEQAISISAAEQDCATRAKQELLFCLEEAKRLMLVDEIAACESELNRIEPVAYPVQVEIAPEPKPE